MRSTSSPFAVSMMIGTVSPAPRRRRQTDKPVLARQHQVEHQQVRRIALQLAVELRRVGKRRDLEALLGQVARQQVAQAHVVVDDEDLRGRSLCSCAIRAVCWQQWSARVCKQLYRRRSGRNVRLQMPRPRAERTPPTIEAEGSSSKRRESRPERANGSILTTRKPDHDHSICFPRLAAVAAAALIGVSRRRVCRSRITATAAPGGGDFVMGIAALKGQLNLNTSQQAMWDNAVAAGKAARDSARANHAASARRADRRARQGRAGSRRGRRRCGRRARTRTRPSQHRQVRDAWLNLYSTFTPDQKTVVKNALQQKLARMEQFREKMQQRRGS